MQARRKGVLKLIGRGPIRVSHLLTISVLVTGLVTAAFVTRPRPVGAAAPFGAGRHHIVFEQGSHRRIADTGAITVGEFLARRGIVIGTTDYVDPSAAMPLADGMRVVYRPAVPIKLVTAAGTTLIDSSASNIDHFIVDENIELGRYDIVRPALNTPLHAGSRIRIIHFSAITQHVIQPVAPPIIHRLDFALAPGVTHIISPGRDGKKSVTIVHLKGDDGTTDTRYLDSKMLAKPKPRIVADGVSRYDAVATTGLFSQSNYRVVGKYTLVATAYTPWCAGCSGYTALGYRAGHGIVAVDPRVIPLGTRLFIPGYGFAVAGDTGGAIKGDRIDLGFTSQGDAMQFGRRVITVYLLK